MSNLFSKIIIAVIFVLSGFLYGLKYGLIFQGISAGLLLGILSIFVESRLRGVSFGSILGGLVGLGTGLLFSNLLLFPLRYLITDESRTLSAFVVNAMLGYGGLFVGLRRGRNLTIPAIMRLFKGQEMEEGLKILDTSVIIDG
ncbi:MAG: hypothetical protein HY099_02170, partial [Nitrospirae bacterium]|nr:hypothetical protein [Nitrospirota bacterium]